MRWRCSPSTASIRRLPCARISRAAPPARSRRRPSPAIRGWRASRPIIVATPKRSLEAAAAVARERGLEVVMLGDNLEGEARALGAAHARQAIDLAKRAGKPTVILSGGETTVTVRGKGRGGRNVEYLLAEAIAANGAAGHLGPGGRYRRRRRRRGYRRRDLHPRYARPRPRQRPRSHRPCSTTMTATASSKCWATALSPARRDQRQRFRATLIAHHEQLCWSAASGRASWKSA